MVIVDKKRVLVVAAHADDETIGCGGTVARLVERGASVRWLILTQPCVPRYDYPDDPVKVRQREARAAADVLGARSFNVTFCDFPEVSLETVKFTDVVARVEEAAAEFRPDAALLPHWADLNQDHRYAFEASAVALRPARTTVSLVLAYSTDSIHMPGVDVGTNVYVALGSEHVRKKAQALACYVTEMRPPPHPRSMESIGLCDAASGRAVVLPQAEAFTLVWTVDELVTA